MARSDAIKRAICYICSGAYGGRMMTAMTTIDEAERAPGLSWPVIQGAANAQGETLKVRSKNASRRQTSGARVQQKMDSWVPIQVALVPDAFARLEQLTIDQAAVVVNEIKTAMGRWRTCPTFCSRATSSTNTINSQRPVA